MSSKQNGMKKVKIQETELQRLQRKVGDYVLNRYKNKDVTHFNFEKKELENEKLIHLKVKDKNEEICTVIAFKNGDNYVYKSIIIRNIILFKSNLVRNYLKHKLNYEMVDYERYFTIREIVGLIDKKNILLRIKIDDLFLGRVLGKHFAIANPKIKLSVHEVVQDDRTVNLTFEFSLANYETFLQELKNGFKIAISSIIFSSYKFSADSSSRYEYDIKNHHFYDIFEENGEKFKPTFIEILEYKPEENMVAIKLEKEFEKVSFLEKIKQFFVPEE